MPPGILGQQNYLQQQQLAGDGGFDPSYLDPTLMTPSQYMRQDYAQRANQLGAKFANERNQIMQQAAFGAGTGFGSTGLQTQMNQLDANSRQAYADAALQAQRGALELNKEHRDSILEPGKLALEQGRLKQEGLLASRTGAQKQQELMNNFTLGMQRNNLSHLQIQALQEEARQKAGILAQQAVMNEHLENRRINAQQWLGNLAHVNDTLRLNIERSKIDQAIVAAAQGQKTALFRILTDILANMSGTEQENAARRLQESALDWGRAMDQNQINNEIMGVNAQAMQQVTGGLVQVITQLQKDLWGGQMNEDLSKMLAAMKQQNNPEQSMLNYMRERRKNNANQIALAYRSPIGAIGDVLSQLAEGMQERRARTERETNEQKAINTILAAMEQNKAIRLEDIQRAANTRQEDINLKEKHRTEDWQRRQSEITGAREWEASQKEEARKHDFAVEKQRLENQLRVAEANHDWQSAENIENRLMQVEIAQIQAALQGAAAGAPGGGASKETAKEPTQAAGLKDRIKKIIDTSGDPQTAEALAELASAGVSLDPSYIDMHYDGRSALFGLKNVKNKTTYVTTLKPIVRKQYQAAMAQIQDYESRAGGVPMSPQDKRKIFMAYLKKGGR